MGSKYKDWIEEARELRRQGTSYAKIGAKVGIREPIVYYALNEKEMRAKNIAYREANRKKEGARYAVYRQTHKEQITEYGVVYRQAHREKARACRKIYYQANKDKIKEYGKAYYQANKEKLNAKKAVYHQATKEITKIRHAAYQRSHLAEYAARNSKRRALIAGIAIGNSISQQIEIKETYRRAKEDLKVRCYLCGKLIAKGHRHVDHIVPVSRKGAHRPSNLAVACDICNSKKKDKMPSELGVLL